MAHKIKLLFRFLLKGIIAYIVLGFIVFAISILVLFFSSDPGFKGRKVLLKQTDFPELIKAGRELINKAELEEYVDQYDVKRDRKLIIPKDVIEPEYIQMFRKRFSDINHLGCSISMSNTGYLVIFFDGSRESGHFGVYICPEDFNESLKIIAGQDNIMIMPGMWYFDDAYDEFPKLREENENMIKKNKYLKNK